MTLHQLQIFDAIAKHLSVSKAAKEIRISQPSLSKQLQSLEHEFGVKFHKQVVGRGIKLTEDGDAFWNELQPILRNIERLKLRFSQKLRVAARLLLAATEGPSGSFIPDALRTFRENYPQIQATLRTAGSRDVEQMVLNSEVEIAVVMYHSSHSRIQVEPLHSIQISAIVYPNHPLARRRKIDRCELLETPFVVKRGGKIANRLEEMGIQMQVAMQCDSIEGIKRAVESGIGIGLLYRENVEREIREGKFKALPLPWSYDPNFQLRALYLKNEVLSTNATRFLEILKDSLKPKSQPLTTQPNSRSAFGLKIHRNA